MLKSSLRIEQKSIADFRPFNGVSADTTSTSLSEAGKFNLSKLVVGSEGTLGYRAQGQVKIEPRPKATALCVVHFKDIVESIRATDFILPFQPSAIELVDDLILNLARGSLELSRQMDFIDGNPGAILLVEFYGENEADCRSRIEGLEAVAQA